MTLDTIAVNEIFGPTYQGEGKSAGMACAFLRLAHCNLSCSWCDTPYSWDWKRYDRKIEVHHMSVDEIFALLRLKAVKSHRCNSFGVVTHERNLVLTGGEPLLQQSRLMPLLGKLKADKWWIEVETNGTVMPSTEFLEVVDQINCSPKLGNSGESEDIRFGDYKTLGFLTLLSKVNFKFVVDRPQDIDEIQSLFGGLIEDLPNIWLMPQGKTREELAVTEPIARQMAEDHGLNFSPRLHINQYGDRRGV